MNTIYYSPSCPNCVRLLSALGEIPSLAKTFRHVDVAQAGPAVRASLTHIPTIVTSQGLKLVGSQCFEFVAKYQPMKELDSLPASGFASGSTLFSSLDDFGSSAATGTMYCTIDEFERPPQPR